MQKKRKQRGFTLIELMIVVVIMSMIGATFVGMAMRMRSQKKDKQSGPSLAARRAVAQTPLLVQRLQPDEQGALRLGSLVQSVTSSVIDARLHVDYLLDNGRVIPVYQAHFDATYHLRNPESSVLLARIFFPFPKGAGTFSALQFQVARAGAACDSPPTSRPNSPSHPPKTPILTRLQPLSCTLQDPQHNLAMGTNGIAWRYAFAPQEEIRVVVRYRVRGRDQYQYQIAAGKKRRFQFKMHIAGVDPQIPPSALQPSRMQRLLEPQHHLVTWEFRDFLTSESIEIRFPPEYAKFHRFSLLGRFAWVALLLFAIFFWYFGERERPDALRSNNLTRLNIALVGIGFVSFFPLFLYLEDHLTMRWAFWLGIGCATLLTTIHVALFMGIRWALWRSLPLQLLVTLSFTAAILFPAYRTIILTIASLLLTVALIALNARYQREARAKALLDEEARRLQEAKQKREDEERQRIHERERLRLERQLSTAEPDPIDAIMRKEPLTTQTTATSLPIQPTSTHPATQHRHCMYCNATVDAHHKHCYACGSFLQRDYNCPSCNTLYWYPAVSSFRYCRSCGKNMHPPIDPTPHTPTTTT